MQNQNQCLWCLECQWSQWNSCLLSSFGHFFVSEKPCPALFFSSTPLSVLWNIFICFDNMMRTVFFFFFKLASVYVQLQKKKFLLLIDLSLFWFSYCVLCPFSLKQKKKKRNTNNEVSLHLRHINFLFCAPRCVDHCRPCTYEAWIIALSWLFYHEIINLIKAVIKIHSSLVLFGVIKRNENNDLCL